MTLFEIKQQMTFPTSDENPTVGSLTLRQRLWAYARLIRLDRPIGILLLLWPALWALWLAGEGRPDGWVVVIFVFGVGLMRSAGCAINDYADRDFDGQVERTNERPLATGLITPRESLGVFVVLSLSAFALVLFLNTPTIMMSFVAAALATVYPFMKRFTHLPQLVLGMAFGWAVPMAYMALTESVPPIAWQLYVAAIIWALIYDTQYAMVDREDDIKIGIKSTAILFGKQDRLIIAILQLIMLGLLLDVGFQLSLNEYYFMGLSGAAMLSVWQQMLIAKREREGCFKAFLNNNYFGMVVFAGILFQF